MADGAPAASDGKPPAAAGPHSLLRHLHIRFIKDLEARAHTQLEYVVAEHLRVSGLYWGAAALDIMGARPRGEEGAPDVEDALPREGILTRIRACVCPRTGAYGGHPGHDAHMLYTLSALQLLAMEDALHEAAADRIAAWIVSLQQHDGSFVGDEGGEVDTRFTYIAFSAMALLGRLADVDVAKAVEFLFKCENFDGGFGAVPGGESHAGQVFCCVGALSIADAHMRAMPGAVGPFPLDRVQHDTLGWWLAERQCDGGGLNGRPEKQSDVCYSWWILSAMAILGKTTWIHRGKLAEFIMECQDPDGGGVADRPGNMADVFHTFFGVAGLSLLGDLDAQPWHRAIDPVYALPMRVVQRMGLPRTVLNV